MEILNWKLRFEISESENSQFENLEFENSESKDSEFENSEFETSEFENFIRAGVCFEKFSGIYLCRQSTLVLKVQP